MESKTHKTIVARPGLQILGKLGYLTECQVQEHSGIQYLGGARVFPVPPCPFRDSGAPSRGDLRMDTSACVVLLDRPFGHFDDLSPNCNRSRTVHPSTGDGWSALTVRDGDQFTRHGKIYKCKKPEQPDNLWPMFTFEEVTE